MPMVSYLRLPRRGYGRIPQPPGDVSPYNPVGMHINSTLIEDAWGEAFNMWAVRLLITADNQQWLDAAVRQCTGYGTSIIGCDCETGLESLMTPDQTPDARPGAAVLLFARGVEDLEHAAANRIGQAVMTCPTTSVFDGMPGGGRGAPTTLGLGKHVSLFGDGYQSAVSRHGRSCWCIPVMDGEFVVQEGFSAVAAVGGGNFMIGGTGRDVALDAARRAVDAIAGVPGVVTPFPGGVVRCGSKVGSRYRGVGASTNEAYCPGLRGQVVSRLPESVGCVYEVVVDGLSLEDVTRAVGVGARAACGPGVVMVTAGEYSGKLGEIRYSLRACLTG